MANKSSPHGAAIVEGSVSTGTLRQQDLLRSFADTLIHHLPFNGARLANEARECADAIDANPDGKVASLSADDIISDLVNELNTIAAREGFYFGNLEGDGADFGFWRNEDEDESEDSRFETVTGTAPSYWAVYFINGDSSGMEDSEIEQADKFAEWLGGNIVSCEDEGFMSSHDAMRVCGTLAADCSTYTALIEKQNREG